MKVYGPYERKDGRKHVVVVDGNVKTTVSYPRYLMEAKLGRKLSDTETVDHINGDFTDDRPENLQISSRSENIKKSVKRVALLTLTCKVCKREFKRKSGDERRRIKEGMKGPYCSKKCNGKDNNLSTGVW